MGWGPIMQRSTWSVIGRSKPVLLQARVLDRVEQVVTLAFFGLLFVRVMLSGIPLAPLMLISEASVVFCILIRRSTATISYRPMDWLLATVGTTAPLLAVPGHAGAHSLVVPGILLALVGNTFQLSAKLVLLRSFGIAPANRGVREEGPYRIVRHPMYAGYFLANVGLLLIMPSLVNLAVYLTAWTAQAFRLQAEERLLSQDPQYVALKQRVRYRVLPFIY